MLRFHCTWNKLRFVHLPVSRRSFDVHMINSFQNWTFKKLTTWCTCPIPGQLPRRWIQVPVWCGSVPGLHIPGRTGLPTWSDWTVPVLECEKHLILSLLFITANNTILFFCNDLWKFFLFCFKINFRFPTLHVMCVIVSGRWNRDLPEVWFVRILIRVIEKEQTWIPVFQCCNRSTASVWERRRPWETNQSQEWEQKWE